MSNSSLGRRGPWKVVESKTVYKNPWMSVREDVVIQPDDKPGIYGMVTMLSGIGVVALDKKKNIYLTKEFHYALGGFSCEVVSGGIEGKEGKLTTAKRELKEEAGLMAKKWTYLGRIYPLTSLISMENHLFLAEGLIQTKARPEPTEKIQILKIPLVKALSWVRQGKIADATSIVALLKTQELLRNR